VTPARYLSCKKLLHGIALLETRNVRDISGHAARCDMLRKEIRSLTEQISHSGYADFRLLQPMSRRIGSAVNHLAISRQELLKAQQKRVKLMQTRKILQGRIDSHQRERLEQDLLEQISEFISGKAAVQPAARNSD
jgi:hypothetical protein